MEIRFDGACRGDAKIFIKVSVEGLPDDHTIVMHNTGAGDKEVPSKLLEFNDYERDKYVAVLPDMPFNQTLSFVELNSKGEVCAQVERTLNPSHMKWESRFNYKLRKGLTKQIRNYDESGKDGKIELAFNEAIPAGENVKLRISCTLPYVEEPALQIRCFDKNMEPLDINCIYMGEAVHKGMSKASISTRQIRYSLVIPNDIKVCLVVVDDAAHTGHEAFALWDARKRVEMTGAWLKVHEDAGSNAKYDKWFDLQRIKNFELARQREVKFDHDTLFSIVVPLYKTPLDLADEMIESVAGQSYAKWELVLVNASPEDEALTARIEAWAEKDARIKIVTLENNEGISLNTRHGIDVARGNYICFLDHDDTIEPNALFEYAVALEEHPDAGVMYCDEDKILFNGDLGMPYFKPDFSIDLLRNNNYICHMLCIKKSIIDEIEPSPKDVDGAQDHDMVLKAIEKTSCVHHIPRVLYHWRMIEGSTSASTENKSYATEAGVRAVGRHIERLGIDAKVTADATPFSYRVRYAVPADNPKVSVVIPTKDNPDVLANCIESIVRCAGYTNYEIVLVENNSITQETFDFYEKISSEYEQVRVVTYEGEFNFSKIVNYGIKESSGDYILLLNDDTEAITEGWMSELVGICTRQDVGAVGVKLLYPDKVVQHAGVGFIDGTALHLNYGFSEEMPGYFGLVNKPQNFSAVTAACMMFRRDVFEKAKGFDDGLAVAYNDIDFCLKIRELGLNIVYWPYVEFIHYESLTRGYDNSLENKIRLKREAARLIERWAEYCVKGDPFYNINLDPTSGWYQLDTEDLD